MRASAVADMADLTDVIQECAGAVRRQFRQWVEYDDLVQEGWLWAITCRERVDEWLATESAGIVKFRLIRHLLRYARREKAERSGYSVDDEYYYSLEMLRVVLPVVLASGGHKPVRGEEPKGRVAVQEYGDWEATYADLRTAFRALAPDDQALLSAYYVQERPSAVLAAELGCTDAAVRNRANAALKRLQKNVGGPPPY